MNILSNKKRAKIQEKNCAKKLSTYLHPGSGALDRKHDSSNDKMLVENKTTKSDSYRITKELLIQLSLRAERRGLMPVLQIGFETIRKDVAQEWAMIPLSDFAEIINV